jgi:hypothetical protein
MISHFPDPLPGELFYSIAARFAARMQYPTLTATMAALFGAKCVVPAIELPHKLALVIASLPPGHGYTADVLIDQHTLFPYYGPFLSKKTHERLREDMKSNHSRITHLLAGIHATKIKPPKFLRTCPKCDAHNIKTYGETYWHRLFQIAGVEVCPTHEVFLQDTAVRRLDHINRHELFTAQHTLRSSEIVPVDKSKHSHRVLLDIARAAVELLDTPRKAVGFEALRERYHGLLQAKGFGTARRLRLSTLNEAFEKHFTPALLKCLQCPVASQAHGGWIANADRKCDSGVAPLRHLLLIRFLGETVGSFFAGIEHQDVKSRPTFCCLNHVCPYHHKPVITEIKLKRKKCPNGSFAVYVCPHCGHTSSRSFEGDRIYRVIDFGHVWNHKLSELWNDARLNLHQIASTLHVGVNTIRRRAVKTGLVFPRRGPKITKIKPRIGQPAKRLYSVEEQRAAWLKLQAANPSLHKQQLRKLDSALHHWLLENDKEWFNSNSPARQKLVRQYQVVDWRARDQSLAGKVIGAALIIKNAPGRARRVTKIGIARELGQASQLNMQLNKLPLTRLALAGVLENKEQFTLRRVRRTVNYFTSIGKHPSQSTFAEVAGIAYATTFPSIQRAIDDALVEIGAGLAYGSPRPLICA